MAARSKVLIFVFDALRPEFVRPDLMPHLCRFAGMGSWFVNSRSTFPTETRVNQTAVLTGCYPWKHGIVGNKFPEPSVTSDRVVNTGADDQIAEALAKARGGLIQMPTMPERLAAAGHNYAALSAGTPGGGRLINHAAEANGTFRLAMHCPEAACPDGVLDEVIDTIGPMPEYQRPALDWIRWAADAYLEYIRSKVDPDVMLLWLCEPDETFHFLGIGSEEAEQTIRNADAQFGRILDHHLADLERGALHIIAMSDHGQISLTGEPLKLVDQMNAAGFNAAKAPGEGVDYTVVAGNAGGIWARGGQRGLVEPMLEWMLEQDWCGPVFTREGLLGTLLLSELRVDHPRAPDIAFAFDYSDAPNANGIAGTSVHDAFYPLGGGCHGGFSPYELENVLIFAGDGAPAGEKATAPVGNVDVLPTVLNVLGVPLPEGLDGAPLQQTLQTGGQEPVTQIISAPNGQTHLSVTDIGGRRYLNFARSGNLPPEV